MRETEKEQGMVFLRYGRAVLLGGIIAFGLSLIFLLLASVGISQGWISAELKYQLTVVSCVLGSFSGGILAVRRCPARGLFVGLAVGGILFLLQLTLGLILYETLSWESGGIGLLFGALCGGAAAGILSGGGKGKKRKIKKHSRR